MTNVLITGPQNFIDYDTLVTKCDNYLKSLLEYGEDIMIVTGDLPGTEALAQKYAVERGFKFKIFPRAWSPYRATVAAYQQADCGIIFWDGENDTIKDTIQYFKRHDMRYRVVNYIYNKNGTEKERRGKQGTL